MATPINMPPGRPATCGTSCAPSMFALRTASSCSAHRSGAPIDWIMRNDTGAPVRFETSESNAISPRTVSRSSPVSPVGTASKSPPPASTIACANATNSVEFANVPGTSSPSSVRWFSEREVETPIAPASIDARTCSAICDSSSLVGSTSRAPRSPMT